MLSSSVGSNSDKLARTRDSHGFQRLVRLVDDFVVAELTITAKKGSETSDRNLDIVMTKEEGVWKILYFD